MADGSQIAPDVPRRLIPLAELYAKLLRILDDRSRLYRLSLKKGNLSAADALEKQAENDAIARVFAALVENQDEFRDVIRRKKIRERQDRDLAEIEANDPVAAKLIQEARDAGATVRLIDSPAHPDDSTDDS